MFPVSVTLISCQLTAASLAPGTDMYNSIILFIYLMDGLFALLCGSLGKMSI